MSATNQELSPRERDIIDLVDRGLRNREIAAELHISDATVKPHLANIFAKLGVLSRSEAVFRSRFDRAEDQRVSYSE